jgi:hypothetical protein
MKGMGTFLVVLAGGFVLAAVAFSALPKKGGTYVGDIKASPFTMHIN